MKSNNSSKAEAPNEPTLQGCRECGNQFFHRVDCPHWIKSYDTATPVVKSQTHQPGEKKGVKLVQDFHRESEERIDGVLAVETERVCPGCGGALQTRSDRKGLVCYRCGYHVDFLGCAKHGFNFQDHCDACQTTEPQSEPRVCQRGVDGSPSCKHLESFQRDGVCYARARNATDIKCDHRCDFSPPDTIERHEYDPIDSTDNAECECGQLRTAPVHKVVNEPRHTLAADSADPMHVYQSAPLETPPARVTMWICPACQRMNVGLNNCAGCGRYFVSDNNPEYQGLKPDIPIEYAHLEPIRKALAKCETNMIEFEGSWDVRKSDYEALCKAIKGDK